ncbi:MAG: phytoene/squalene synthase family protein [Acidocella sp.]|nr:phytoene/squalene synthase family protein [Acidocella sp.]
MLCSGSRSFFVASRLLPARVRNPATALYAFCRVADDLIDLGNDKPAALTMLEQLLDLAYAGQPAADPVNRAFAATLAQFQIPKTLPAALLEGLAWDAQGRHYASFGDLLDYAARVAGSVGVMMALLMGVREAGALARAADLGIAMQLTNIARDVGEDAAAGRLFLPLDWMAEAGIDAQAFLKAPQFSSALAGVVRRLLDEAGLLYARGRAGLASLPLDCRPGIAAAARIYQAIGARIADAGYNSITQRAHVSGRAKAMIAGRALSDCIATGQMNNMTTLPANLFLITAAAVEITAEPTAIIKLLTMFERLERSQREAASGIAA